MHKYLITVMVSCSAICADGQLAGVINEVIYTDDGSIPGYPTGYSTYRIYALLMDETDVLTSIYGNDAGGVYHPLNLGSTVPNSVWNAEGGGNYGQSVDCSVFDIVPAMAYDSYVTIGLTSEVDDACQDCSGVESPAFIINFPLAGSAFGNTPYGDNLFVGEGAMFVLNEGYCNNHGQGDDYRVLLAQLTVPTGTLTYCLNLQVIDDGIAGSSLLYVNDLGDPPTIEIDGMPLGICGSSSTSIDMIGHDQLSVYPNPANNYLQIESADPIDAVHLYTLCGQRVLSEIPGGKQRITLNTASLDAGLYLLETVTSGGTGKRHRIVIR